MAAGERWRGLRVRHKLLQDMVLGVSAVSGWPAVGFLCRVFVESALFLAHGASQMPHLPSVLDGTAQAVVELVSPVAVALLYEAHLVFLYVVCQRPQRQCNKLRLHLQEYAISNVLHLPRPVKREVDMFLLQISMNETRCSVLGLFYLDTRNLKGLLQGIALYVTILFQFNAKVVVWRSVPRLTSGEYVTQ